ncbi:class II aldolase/adducin family protein [Kitasatospora sp. NPDC001539]|uniref:class II aldolase/adducin family protein n=1 Tax=Kitasatospora sp. NPDC001539 TaxID=3154384 RepID=UPI00331B5A5B
MSTPTASGAGTPLPASLAAAVGPLPPGVTFPLPPTFDSVEQERRYRKEQLAAGFRLFGRFGFSEGVAGHITVRDPEHPDRFWVNPFGMPFGMIRASDLILVDHEGTLLHGSRPVNRAAFVIHSQVHAARPDAIAAAHAHSLHGKAFSSLGILLDPLTQDACAFFEDHGLYSDYRGVVNEVDEGKRIAGALGPHKAVILQNHGLLTVGQSVAEAVWWFVTMERSCQAQLLAMAAGTPKPIDRETALITRGQIGSNLAGWFQAQPLFEQIGASDPDLAD